MAGVRDNLFGAVAVQWGFCSAAEMEECLALQRDLGEKGEAVPRLGEILAHKGYMTPDQVRAVLDGQHRQAEGLFGEIAVRWRFCSEEQIQECLDEQARTDAEGDKHARLGEILHGHGYLKKHQVRAILQAQRKSIAVCNGCGRRFNVSGYEYGAKLRCAACGTVTILRQDPRESSTGKDDDIEVDGTVFIPKKDLPVKEEPRLEIGGYEVYSRLGSDATGTVCKASHLESGADVALKIMHSAAMQDPAFLNRFIEEGKVATTLDHPNIKNLYEVGLDQGRYFFSTEYIEGASIRRIVESGRLFTPVQALDVAIQIASALEYVHSRGVVHGDLKPSCVLITVDGQVKIDGMGIAKDVAGNLKKLAASGEALPLYLAPELAVNPDHPTPRADIYSTGAVLYHMLTGRPPYQGESPLEVLMRVSEETPPSIHRINPEVPPYVSGIVDRMLSAEAEERQESAADLVLELRAAHEKIKREAAKGVHGTPAKAMEPVATLARGTHEVQPTVKGVAPVTEAVRHRIERREESSPALWLVAALVIGVAVAGGAVIYLKPRPPIIEPTVERVRRPEPDGSEAPDPRLVEAEKRVRKSYEDLLEYRDANRNDPEAVYERYKRFLADYESSVVGKTYVQQAVGQAKEYRAKAAQAAYEKVRDDSRELVLEKNFAQAIEDARGFLAAYGDAEVASSARRLLRTLQDSQTEGYKNARQKAENYIARGQIDDAKRLLQKIAQGFSEQFADPARKRLAELDAMGPAAVEQPVPEPPKVDDEAKRREREIDAKRSLTILKGSIAEQLKIFGFEKAASLAAAAAARHAGTEAGREMALIEKDVDLARGALKSFVEIINSGRARNAEVKVAGKKLPISSATELVVNVRDRSGLSMRVPWHRISADEIRVLLRTLADKGAGTQNLGLGILYHYRGEPGWAKVAMARARRAGADTSHLEKIITEAESSKASQLTPVGPVQPSPTEKRVEKTTTFTFEDPADLGKFEKVAGLWQASGGAIVGRGDPASLQLMCEGMVEASGRIRFEKLDCNVQISAGKWSIFFQLRDSKVVLSESGPNRKEIDFAAAANTWYDWAIRLERKSAHEIQLGFYLNSKEQAAFRSGEPQTGKLWFMVDRNGGIWLDNISVKGLVKTRASIDKEAGLKRLQAAGWRVTSGAWSMDADGVIRGRADRTGPARAEKPITRPFQLAVSIKGSGDLAGVSFGDKKDFCVDPSDTWQAVSLKVQYAVDFTIDKTPQWGAGDHTGVRTPGDVGDTVILKTDDEASFKGFDVMPLK